ncbi:hypothetical protein BVX93_00230, partial [bacterium B13(2017)]
LGLSIIGLTASESQEFIELFNLGITDGDLRYDALKSKIILASDARYNFLKESILTRLNLSGITDARFNELIGAAHDGHLEIGADIMVLDEIEEAEFIEIHNKKINGEELTPHELEKYENLKNKIIAELPLEERINDDVLGMILGIDPGGSIPVLDIPFVENPQLFALLYNVLHSGAQSFNDESLTYEALIGAVNSSILAGTLIPGLNESESEIFIEKYNAKEFNDAEYLALKTKIQTWVNLEYETMLEELTNEIESSNFEGVDIDILIAITLSVDSETGLIPESVTNIAGLTEDETILFKVLYNYSQNGMLDDSLLGDILNISDPNSDIFGLVNEEILFIELSQKGGQDEFKTLFESGENRTEEEELRFLELKNNVITELGITEDEFETTILSLIANEEIIPGLRTANEELTYQELKIKNESGEGLVNEID